ncbi:hypothetical protein ACF0H5_017632 [Mactra antiquata]
MFNKGVNTARTSDYNTIPRFQFLEIPNRKWKFCERCFFVDNLHEGHFTFKMIEPPPFRSVEEAEDFLRNHEIATNNKYISMNSKNYNQVIALNSIANHRIRWEFQLSDGVHFDGSPYVILAVKSGSCQYGVGHKTNKPSLVTPAGFKQRRRACSKKVNCPAKIKFTMLLKFPDYCVGDNNTEHSRRHMATKLREDFNEDTQRYLLVFLRITNNHEHGVEHILLNNMSHREIKVSKSLLRNASVTTLKSGATLRGKNMSGLITQFNCINELPVCPAQPSLSQSLDQMGVNELLALYCELTGDTPNSVFASAQKEFSEENLRLLLHLCIVFANNEAENSTQRVAHQSVRLNGTEVNFSPVTCFDATCPLSPQGTHLHCPFCSKVDGFSDAGTLKIHFSERHIAKSVEFGGMRFLRCLGECATKDFVKDMKIYLHGHWHCWKCTKLFNKKAGFMRHIHNHAASSTSNTIQLDKNYYPTPNPSLMTHVVKMTKEESNYGYDTCNPSISQIVEHEPVEYKATTGTSTSTSLTESDYTFTQTTAEEVLHPEYERAILYIQDNDQIVYAGDLQENEGEVVIHMSETEVDVHQRLRELEHKCMELERENMAYKSHIEFLNNKVEELTAQKQSAAETSLDISQDKESTETVNAETSVLNESLTRPKNIKQESKEKTKDALLQSLQELRSNHKKKTYIPEDSVLVSNDTVYDINTELTQIRTEVEQLKMALAIGSHLQQTVPKYVPAVQPKLVTAMQPTVYMSNFGLTGLSGLSVPAVVPQSLVFNPGTATTTVMNKPNVAINDNSKTNVEAPADKNPESAKDMNSSETSDMEKNGGEIDLTNDGDKDAINDEEKNGEDQNETIELSEGNKENEQEGNSDLMDTNNDDNGDDDDDILEITDTLDTTDAEEKGRSAVEKTTEAGSQPPPALIQQSNVMVPIGIAPTGKIVTYLHMPTQPMMLTSPSTFKIPTANPVVIGSLGKGAQDSTDKGEGSGNSEEVGTTDDGEKETDQPMDVDSTEGAEEFSEPEKESPDQCATDSTTNEAMESPTKTVQAPHIVMKEQALVSKDNKKGKPTPKEKATESGTDKTKSSSVVLAVVNDIIHGGKKVVSLVQESEHQATISIPFEYKSIQKERKRKEDGTFTEVKKECTKNQIKLKVKGNVKALQGDALQKIVDSALTRFTVGPSPAKKQRVK